MKVSFDNQGESKTRITAQQEKAVDQLSLSRYTVSVLDSIAPPEKISFVSSHFLFAELFSACMFSLRIPICECAKINSVRFACSMRIPEADLRGVNKA